MDYAIAVYSRALREVVAYYPQFGRHTAVDGPLAGERRLVFPNQLDEAAACWIRSRFYQLAEKGDITVSESFVARFENGGATVGGRENVIVDVVLDRERTDKSTWEEVSAIVATGKPFPIDSRPRRCDVRLACEMLAELSLPELVALNWSSVKKSLTEADRRLFAAIDAFDFNAAKDAMEAGADPNAISESNNDTPLTNVLDFRWIEQEPYVPRSQEEYIQRNKELGPNADEVIRFVDLLISAGAAVDWAGYDETTPLAEACLNADAKVISHLLQHGADPSIRCYHDEYPNNWGNAWECADYRCNPYVDNADESAWAALIAKWPAPYGDVRID